MLLQRAMFHSGVFADAKTLFNSALLQGAMLHSDIFANAKIPLMYGVRRIKRKRTEHLRK